MGRSYDTVQTAPRSTLLCVHAHGHTLHTHYLQEEEVHTPHPAYGKQGESPLNLPIEFLGPTLRSYTQLMDKAIGPS